MMGLCEQAVDLAKRQIFRLCEIERASDEISRYDAAHSGARSPSWLTRSSGPGGIVTRCTCLIALLFVGCQTEKMVVRVGSPCVIHHDDGTTPLTFRAWHRIRGYELMEQNAVIGVVEDDCLATQIPAGPTRYVSQSGAELYDAPNPHARSGLRLEGRRPVRVIDVAGAFSLVASEISSFGYVQTVDLAEEARLVEELAIELHWAWERGHRMVVAAQLAALGADAIKLSPLRELACRAAFSGLTDPFWVDELHADDCDNRPAFANVGVGLDVEGTCASGREVSVTSATLTSWSCVTPSAGAQIFGVDYAGHIEKIGDVIVSQAGTCPQARVLGLHTVGLGVCLEAVVKDDGCADATGDQERGLYCLPPPSAFATAEVTEITTAFKRSAKTNRQDGNCGGARMREPASGQSSPQESECFGSSSKSGTLASFHVVRRNDNYLLCVRGAHFDGGPRNVAYEFSPGRIVEMEIWPGACDIDDSTTWLSTLALVEELKLDR
ncbi:MAG: hypothetical protein A2341_07045 [Deltaproteobacteria bacterium RIFOXYB12_FULL_58_9]|nr:MAG: hypothetical protein A2341_07045 [Deltaproteobacteria bacterium RIFOXYB12_FULL_58_9]